MTAAKLLTRPIHGGAFGDGTYALATQPVVAAGLHAVRYSVIEPRLGLVLSTGPDKLEVLAAARHSLRCLQSPPTEERWQQGELFPALPVPQARGDKPASRRRREVFERSQGMCCYCHAGLQLAGPWHVEHQMPRALDGADRGINLVAACVACNLAKGDRTALEFIARPAAPSK